ncbi:MAG: LysE family translocator, partial [Verrucomicrobia bacterium]|nr:LysE family translocator [Verrucomicrobiota bacterium]MBI3870548.1 LysE family translocator [Verrucomicrobiota bacterium]
MNAHVLLLYLLTWSLVALTPGPAVMCSMAQAGRYGFRSSWVGIAGIQLGNVVFFVCVAAGLGALLETTKAAFDVLRALGAGYLFYLGARLILSTLRKGSPTAPTVAQDPPARSGLFLQGLLIQLTNPKALLFVSSLLPQFIDREGGRPVSLQLSILVLLTIVVDGVVLSSYAWLAARGGGSLRNSRSVAWIERILGLALVGFGVRLLATRK